MPRKRKYKPGRGAKLVAMSLQTNNNHDNDGNKDLLSTQKRKRKQAENSEKKVALEKQLKTSRNITEQEQTSDSNSTLQDKNIINHSPEINKNQTTSECFIATGRELCHFKYNLRKRAENGKTEVCLESTTEEPFSPAVSEYLPSEEKPTHSASISTDKADTVSLDLNVFLPGCINVPSSEDTTMPKYVCKTLAQMAMEVLNSRISSKVQERDQVNKQHSTDMEVQIEDKNNRLIINEEKLVLEIEEIFSDTGENNVEQGTEKKKKKRVNPKKDTPGRKRVLNKDKWKSVICKKRKNLGEEYVNKKGRFFPKKEMKRGCGFNCLRHCREKITEENRKKIFKDFWALGDHNKQMEYLCRLVKKVPKKSITVRNGEMSSRRTWSYEYYLVFDEEIRVCKKMFLDTLAITDMWLRTMFQKMSKTETSILEPDRRGRHTNRQNAIDEDIKKSVRDHISLIPAVESHYVRSRTSKLYFEENLNIPKLHNLYEEWMNTEHKNKTKATLRQYRDIFNQEFNIDFHKPKKDQCPRCDFFYKKASESEKIEMERNHALHIASKEIARTLMDMAEEKAEESENVVFACYDLQKILATPQSEVSLFYYKRKLSVYNFTIFEPAEKAGYCYLWNETIGKKGSNEISSFVYDFIKKSVKKGARQFIFFSDSCCGQNKNRIVFGMYARACKIFNIDIKHNFFEVGHSQSEGDSMHALIERRKKYKEIYTPDQWATLIRCAKSTGKPYELTEVSQDIIYDFKTFGQQYPNWTIDNNNEKVLWMKIKHIHFSSTAPHLMRFMYDNYDETERTLDLTFTRESARGRGSTQESTRGRGSARGRRRQGSNRSRGRGTTGGRGRGTTGGRECDVEILNRAYNAPLPISAAKYKDLWSLCTARAIPAVYHDFYKNLPVSNNRVEFESDSDQ